MPCDHPDRLVEADPYSDEPGYCTGCGAAVDCDGPWDDDGTIGWVTAGRDPMTRQIAQAEQDGTYRYR